MSNESAPHECLILIAFFPSIGTHKWPQSISCSGFSWWTSVMNRAVSSVPILKLMLTVFWRKNTCLKLIITSLVMGSYVDVATCVLMQMQDLFQACPLPLKPGGICKWRRWLSSTTVLLKKRKRQRGEEIKPNFLQNVLEGSLLFTGNLQTVLSLCALPEWHCN